MNFLTQGGKGVCDRKATTIKGDIGRYVNEGNDVIDVLQFKTAIKAGQGTTGVRGSYVAAKPGRIFNVKWDGKAYSTIVNMMKVPDESGGHSMWVMVN